MLLDSAEKAILPKNIAEDTVVKLFLRRVDHEPDRVALRKKEFGIWHDISYQEYLDNVRQVSCGFLAMGMKKGERICIIGENTPQWLYIDLGVMCAGGITAGIYSTNSAAECAYILEHSQSRFYFVENEEQLDKALEVREKLPLLEKIIVWDMEGLRHFKDPMVMSFDQWQQMGEKYHQENLRAFEQRAFEIKAKDTAVLIYTSGTTGPPKGAMLSHYNLRWTTWSLSQAIRGIKPKDNIISFLPLCHIAERMFSVFMALHFGYRVNFAESPDTVSQNVVEISPTIFFAVPRIWEKYYSAIFIRMKDATRFKQLAFNLALKAGKRFFNQKMNEGRVSFLNKVAFNLAHWLVFKRLKKRLGLERIHIAISGAAPISPKILMFFQSIGIPMREVYGQTEGSGPTTLHRNGEFKVGTVGPPLPGVEVKIARDGEILVKGGNVFQGYFRNSEATGSTLQEGWLYSGDVGEFDQFGCLKITDRKKDLIVTAGGKNIAPQNIENQLKFSPYINDAIIIGDKRKYLVALIIIDEDNVVKFAQQNKVQFTTYSSLTRQSEIYKLIETEVDQVNQDLARVEQVKRFSILPKKLLEEDGEVTPTMKVKRKNIAYQFQELIQR